MRSSSVTTANQSGPRVKAVAVVSFGRVMAAGSGTGSGTVRMVCGTRMTTSVIMVTSPPIIVAVRMVTMMRRNRRLAGSDWGSGRGLDMGSTVGSDVGVVRLEVAGPTERLDKALSRAAPEGSGLSRSRLRTLIESGSVCRDQDGTVIRDTKFKAQDGEVFVVLVPAVAEAGRAEAEDIPLEIVYEDPELVVVNKPAGMVVHPAPGTPGGTLVNALLHHFGSGLSGAGGAGRPGIVHRIDKDTSGLIVVARTDRAHQGLAAQFEAHSVEREYLAICHGVPDGADPRLRGVRGVSVEKGVVKVQTFLGRHRTDRQKQAVSFDAGRHAVTLARVLEPLGRPPAAALISCRLQTGRTHQIRVHMAHIGHGLIGDPVYGGRRRLNIRSVGEAGARAASGFSRQALHAATLGFLHPVSGASMRFSVPLPADMADLLTALGGDPFGLFER